VATRTLHVIHFNDVYNIEPREQEPVGGVAKFVTRVREIQQVGWVPEGSAADCLDWSGKFRPICAPP